MVLSTGGGGTCVLTPRAPLPPPASLTLAYARLFLSTFSQSPLPAAAVQQVFPFFNVLYQRHNQHCSSAELWPVAGPFGAIWNWVLPNIGRASRFFSQRPHLQPPPLPPPTKSLPRKPHTLPNHICLKTSFLTFPLLILWPIPTGDGE